MKLISAVNKGESIARVRVSMNYQPYGMMPWDIARDSTQSQSLNAIIVAELCILI